MRSSRLGSGTLVQYQKNTGLAIFRNQPAGWMSWFPAISAGRAGRQLSLARDAFRSFYIRLSRLLCLLFLHLTDKFIIFGHDVIPILYAVVVFLDETVALSHQIGDGIVLPRQVGVGFLQG